MRKYNINANLVRATEHLYDKAKGVIQMNGSTGEWFRIDGVRQRCLLSSTLFNIFRLNNMSDALEEYNGNISIVRLSSTPSQKIRAKIRAVFRKI